ncbi:MAG: SDR family NAD(P)-dependent oxidoreductase, partial [Gammaproteobacteria bacterium]|nr:SDR family NAD(P)-dependent oxidoreductase [Gammaproteobacteria bacterium]
MKQLTGKTAVITGAAAGVGRAASLLFAREGAAVACVDSHTQMGAQTAQLVRAEGGEAIFVEADLADANSIARMARDCMDWHPDIHVLFNSASIAERADFEQLSLDT